MIINAGHVRFFSENRNIYLQDISDGQSPGKGRNLVPIFVTKADRQRFNSIQNKTKEQVKNYIMREIDQIRELGADHQADALKETWNRKVRTQTKDAFIMFYKTEVLVALDDVISEHPLLGTYLFEYPLSPIPECCCPLMTIFYIAFIHGALVVFLSSHWLPFHILARIFICFLHSCSAPLKFNFGASQ